MPEQVAQAVVETCVAQAKIVAEQQQKEKEEAAQRKAEEEAAATAVLGGPGGASAQSGLDVDAQAEAAAASILGGSPQPPSDQTEPADSDSTDPDQEPATPVVSTDEAVQSVEPQPTAEPPTNEQAASAQPASGAGE